MTNIRLASLEDIPAIERLHKKYYADQFDLPQFKNFLRTFVVTNKHDELIIFGGARLIVEVIAMTNKDARAREKHDALYKLLYSVERVSNENSFDQIHVFPEKNGTWRTRLQKDGFEETKYPCFVKDI